MMLALLLLSCLAVAVLSAAAVRRRALSSWLAVPLATALPLLGWLAFQAAATEARSPFEFQVLGQYHRLADTLVIGTDSAREGGGGSDVVLSGTSLPDTRVKVSYAGGADSIHVRVARSTQPVLIGGDPVNGARLTRRARIAIGPDTVVIVRPWWCIRCDVRVVRRAELARYEVRLSPAAAVPLGQDTILLFRSGSQTYAAADPAAGATVDGAAIPDRLSARSDSLQFGVPARAALLVHAIPAAHRMEVRFSPALTGRWSLPRTPADTPQRLLVAATNGMPLPGVMPVLNPGAVAPGAATVPYGGVLQQHEAGWEWLAGGVTRPFALNVVERLPGDVAGRSNGHLVQLRQTDTQPGAARVAVVIAWLAGALALAWSLRLLHPEALALRVFLLGCIYALVAVRGILAFRAWLAPPHDANSPITFLALLLALPALTALLHGWHLTSSGLLARPNRWRELGIGLAPMAAAALTVAALVLPAWRFEILRSASAAVLIGVLGLALLNRLLLTGASWSGRAASGRLRAGAESPARRPGSTDPRRAEPLAAIAAPSDETYPQRQFLSALTLLGVLAFLLLVVTELVKYGTLLALVAWAAIMGMVVLATSAPRVLIRPRRSGLAMPLAAAAAVAAGGLTLLLGRGLALAAAALVVVGGATLWLARRPSLRLRPVHVRDLAGPPLVLAMAAALGAVLMPDLVTAGRVLAEYALALAGLFVIARIFALLWFRQARQLFGRRHGARANAPRALAIALVLLLLAALIYSPLALFDSGLVLLFFAATVTVVCAGFFMIGARALAGGIAVAVVLAFIAGMFVRRSDLLDGSASLSTAQIRYAAAYHPAALQRHMLTTTAGKPTTTVRTLQQYWGMRYFAAGGTAGQGYFGADYAEWIVPRPVALTENVFSTFVLSEHGWAGGVAVLLCYLAIALALLYGAWRACSRQPAAPRALLLVGIAAFWVVPAFYIAAANGVLVPLTGQNMAMLGLLSSADAALATWLAALGLVALPALGESGAEHVRAGGWTRRLRAAVATLAGIFAVAFLGLSALLWRPTHASVGSFRLDGLIADVEALVEQGVLAPARATPDTIAITAAGERHPLLPRGGFLRQRVRRANAMARGEAGGAGCLDSDPLLRVRSDGGIAVFSALCSIRSVVEGQRDWQGALLVDAAVPDFAITDGRSSVILDPRGTGVAAIGPGCGEGEVIAARSVRIGCTRDAPVLRFGTTAPLLESGGGAGSQNVAPAGRQPGGTALLNERPVTAPTLLGAGAHVRVTDQADAWVLEIPRGALAYARWENGRTRRIHVAALPPWLAQLDSQLARGLGHRDREAWNAVSTLRPSLQARLQQAVADACAAAPDVRRCSALIADPLSGEVLALTATYSQPHRYLPADANLRNHPAASTIKPIMAAAALHAFPSLRTLQVDHRAAEYSVIANASVRPPLRAPRLYPSPVVPWAGFLGASDNLYEVTLGFLAASDRPTGDGAMPALRGTAEQSGMRVNGSVLRGAPSWVGTRMNLSTSPLANSLQSLFEVQVAGAAAPPYDARFWSAAVEAGALVESGDLQRITPEPVTLAMDRIGSARAFAGFLLGGGSNRWSNLALVQAFSRIFTGRAVSLYVLRAVGPHALEQEPAQLPALGPVRESVLAGLDAVVNQPWGTGRSLRGAFGPNVSWRAKTGTLREREWNGSVFLWAGSAAPGGHDEICSAAGILTLEMSGNASPDGRATAMFRDAIAPLLQEELGWGSQACRATRISPPE